MKVSKLENGLGALIAITLFLVGLFAIYWVFKTVSYQVFYESMVLDTIRETVREAALK